MNATPPSEPRGDTWPDIYAGAPQRYAYRMPHWLPQAQGRPAEDARAAWRRWHDPSVKELFTPREWRVFIAFERARVEQLAAQGLPGMRENLTQTDQIMPPAPVQHLYLLARESWQSGGWPQHRAGLARRWLAPLQSLQMTEQYLRDQLVAIKPELRDAQGFARAISPLVKRLSRRVRMSNGLKLPLLSRTSATGRKETGNDNTGQAGAPLANTPESFADLYNKHDLVLDAARLATDEDRRRFQTLGTDRQHLGSARRLLQRLTALQKETWEPDVTEGMVDVRRLTRLVTQRNDIPAIFRQRRLDAQQACAISLLIDQSGSMAGQHQELAVQAADLLMQTLEQARIPSELLGYTTRYGAENPLYHEWVSRGKPDAPGRLNGVLHLVYKGFQHAWRPRRSTLGMMLRSPPGDENLDAEALNWAASRLERRPEAWKILIVLSDGCPCDPATSEANGRGYLDTTLHAAIANQRQGTTLMGVGVGWQVARFYPNAIQLKTPESLPMALFEHLEQMLTRPRG